MPGIRVGTPLSILCVGLCAGTAHLGGIHWPKVKAKRLTPSGLHSHLRDKLLGFILRYMLLYSARVKGVTSCHVHGHLRALRYSGRICFINCNQLQKTSQRKTSPYPYDTYPLRFFVVRFRFTYRLCHHCAAGSLCGCFWSQTLLPRDWCTST